MLARRLLVLALPLALVVPPAFADDVGPEDEAEDTAEEEDDDDDDKGCATVVAPVSALSLALGVGIVLTQRRRED